MRVYRQCLRNRLVHWGIALSCFGLIVTGILQMPVAKRYGLTQIFPTTADFFATLSWHYAFAIVFTFLCVFHLIVHALEGDFDIVPRKGDFKESVKIIKALLSAGKDPPPAGNTCLNSALLGPVLFLHLRLSSSRDS